MLQTFSLTIGGVAQHLISYYKIEDVEQGRLRSPSSLPELASLTISPALLRAAVIAMSIELTGTATATGDRRKLKRNDPT